MAVRFFYTFLLLAVIASAVLSTPIDSHVTLTADDQNKEVRVETVKVEAVEPQLTRQGRQFFGGYPGIYGGYGYPGIYSLIGYGGSGSSASASASSSSGGMGFVGK